MELKGFKFLKIFRINGVVIYPFVLYADNEPGELLRKHEEIHLQQLRRDGVLRFYGRYFFEYLQARSTGLCHHDAYRSISYEREAFARQSDPAYQVNRSGSP